jgi:hypothetical protein
MKQHVDLLCENSRSKSPRTPAIKLRGRRVEAGPHFAAIAESDRWIENDLISSPDSAVYLDPRAQIALHVDLTELRFAIVDNRDLHSVAVEDDGICRHHEARRLARDLELDRAVDARGQRIFCTEMPFSVCASMFLMPVTLALMEYWL